MEFTINIENYKQFLQKEKFLVIDSDFIKNNFLETCPEIIIKDIKDKDLLFHILNVDLPKTKIKISDCIFSNVSIMESTIGEIFFNTVEVSEIKEGKYALFQTFIDTSKLKLLWFYNCKLYNGLIVRKESEIDSLSINETLNDRSFTFLNSICKTITVESSNILEISIDRNDYPKKNCKTKVDTINIFRTEGLKNIKIRDVEFKNLHIHKTILLKSDKLNDHNNEIYINSPVDYTNIEEIKISESTIATKIIIAIDSVNYLGLYKSYVNNLVLNYWYITSLHFSECSFSGSVYFGHSNRIKTIDKLLLVDCTFDDAFNMSSILFKEEASFRGLIFKKYPSFFYQNVIIENCKIDFKYSNLKNLVFQEIDFSFFSFTDFDISNVEFKDCKWQEVKSSYISRNLVFDENKNEKTIDHLLNVKDIYSKLKTSTLKSSDFINNEKFYISEQEIKRKIHHEKKDWTEYALLGFHKAISTYGENFKKPLLFILLSILSFAIIFLFTGFYKGDKLVNYELSFNASNFICTVEDFGYSFLYSLKNILPFVLSPSFYLHSDKTLEVSQTLELIHKLINIIIATSFTAAFLKYLKK